MGVTVMLPWISLQLSLWYFLPSATTLSIMHRSVAQCNPAADRLMKGLMSQQADLS